MRRDELAEELRRAKVDLLTLRTDRPWLDELVAFIGRRHHRIVASSGARR